VGTPLKRDRLVAFGWAGGPRLGGFSFPFPVHGILVMIIEVLANLVHFLVQGIADGGRISLAASDAADEGGINAQTAGNTAEEAAKKGERGERSRGIIRLVTIHDAFQEHGSKGAILTN
jgi:hypothetical protein